MFACFCFLQLHQACVSCAVHDSAAKFFLAENSNDSLCLCVVDFFNIPMILQYVATVKLSGCHYCFCSPCFAFSCAHVFIVTCAIVKTSVACFGALLGML